jgi:hypothetical protein
MNDETIYPNWGTFGTATENTVRELQPEAVTGAEGSTWELKIKVGDIEIETNPADTPEQIKAAMQGADDLNKLQAKAKRERLRLTRCDHSLKNFIEVAMSDVGATTFNETEAVWRRMVAMADSDDAPNHVIGYTPSKRAIKYQGQIFDKLGEYDYFKKQALAQLFWRQKANANPRPSTPAHGQ